MNRRRFVGGSLAAGGLALATGGFSFDHHNQAGPVDRSKRDSLSNPIPVEVDGKPLVREGDGFVPFVGDLQGDGRQSLLLGTRGQEGRLLIYRNVGTPSSPQLKGPQWFDEMVPTGRIPKG